MIYGGDDMSQVDIVLRWVDDTDKEWLSEKRKYKLIDQGITDENVISDTSDIRYRDWNLLRFWFRGVEKFAPWVNKIFFVTCNGQKPSWLKTDHSKLRMVDHKEFIPEEWLPTFSSRTIDFNIYRIPDLSEQFVFFDDDMFIIKPTKDADFFQNGLPCDSMVFNAITAACDDVINTNIYNDMAIINRHFDKSNFNRLERQKMWYTPKYGKYLYKNIVLAPWTYYTGFQDFHLPEGFLKSTYREMWEKENEWLSETCSHKFRKTSDVNQWLIRYWQLVGKKFVPRSVNVGQYYELSDDNTAIVESIRKQKTKLLCINEGNVTDFEAEKKKLQEAFSSILPEKSEYEL